MKNPNENQKVVVLASDGKIYLCKYERHNPFFGKSRMVFRNIMSKFAFEIKAQDWEGIELPKRWLKNN